MKIRILILLIVFALSANAQEQKQRTLYYNSQWELTTKDSATYYRTCMMDTLRAVFTGEVKDYSMDGKLLMEGVYLIQDNAIEDSPYMPVNRTHVKNGIFTSYYPSGQIESQGEFKRNSRIGVWKYFYEDGRTWREIKFNKDEFFVLALYDKEGALLVKDGTGEWTFTYQWYKVPKIFIVKGKFLDGRKAGEWVCGFTDGESLYKETFKNGKFKNGYYTNPDGSKKEEVSIEFQNKFVLDYKYEVTEKLLYERGITRNDYPFIYSLPRSNTIIQTKSYKTTPSANSSDSIQGEKVFLVVETPPEFEGGNEAMHKFVASNLKYPYSAKRMQIEGTVFVSFIIEADGKISEAKVVKGISPDCDKEALRVILLMPKWKPGMQSGKAVRVRFVYPIKFWLGR